MKYKWLWIAAALLLLLGILVSLQPKTGNAPQTPPTEGTQSTDPTAGTLPPETEQPGETVPTHETVWEEQTAPSLPQDLPPVVELPVETDPVTGAQKGITFPARVEGYDLVIEKLAPYDGMFVEDGSNVQVQGVAMLMLKNDGDHPLEYAQITVEYEGAVLTFQVTALPVGERLVVQEASGQRVPQGEPKACKALIVRRSRLSMSESSIKITENSDDSITVTNLTKETIPTVRVFYKYYMADQNIYVGGIAFTVRLTRLGAGSSVTVRPAHYTKEACKVVMVLTYDGEV